MPRRAIQSVAVLGAGTMGARIAAHCANVGMRVLLLDLSSKAADRDATAARGLEAARRSRPPAFYTPEISRRVTLGNFDDNLRSLRETDWIVEAVSESLDIKQALLQRVAACAASHAVLSTNTSGLRVAAVGAALPPEFRRRWLGTHFFNPPRYLHLVELIATPDTEAAVRGLMIACLDQQLGKGVVEARDTPNFIGNRIGVFALLNVLRLMEKFGFDFEQIDALTGSLLGWPKSATFRTLDLIGLDTLAHVVRNSHAALSADEHRDLFVVPPVIEEMMRRGWLGDKSGQGFYRKGPDGQIEVLDPATWTYRPRRHPRFSELAPAMAIEDAAQRLQAATQSRSPAGEFVWTALRDVFAYAAARVPEIAPNAPPIDRAMRWGYGWHWGPFELWDVLGFERVAERMGHDGMRLPPFAAEVAAGSRGGFYRWGGETESPHRQTFLPGRNYEPVPFPTGVLELEPLRRGGKTTRENPGCSLIALGKGVGCLEFHRKMNAIGGDIVAMVTETLRADESEFNSFVIGNEADNFSVGADLLFLLLTIQNEDWDEVDHAVRTFQAMNLAVWESTRPVVMAPAGMTLGGGCEMLLHARSAVAHVELYCGLVEMGVGLIPAGGGCAQMAARATAWAEHVATVGPSQGAALQTAYQTAFETIALAKVSGSAIEAQQMGWLPAETTLAPNRDRLLHTARAEAHRQADGGASLPPANRIVAPGPGVQANLEWAVFLMREAGRITAFEEQLGKRLAHVLCAGGAPAGAEVSGTHMRELEREAFLSLCGEPKTQERIAHMLATGKVLRN